MSQQAATRSQKLQGVLALGGMFGLFALMSPAAAGSLALVGAVAAGKMLGRPTGASGTSNNHSNHACLSVAEASLCAICLKAGDATCRRIESQRHSRNGMGKAQEFDRCRHDCHSRSRRRQYRSNHRGVPPQASRPHNTQLLTQTEPKEPAHSTNPKQWPYQPSVLLSTVECVGQPRQARD